MVKQGKLRIIAGKWKRRTISFPAIQNLRPSPDAVRETLFNWLRQDLSGLSCLDLFAGSGALGLEAASRGARHVDMVEINQTAANHLQSTVERLQSEEIVKVHTLNASAFIRNCKQQYDVVFLDPPFQKAILETTCQSLIDHHCLSNQARVYIESPQRNTPLPIPSTWHIIRQSARGMVQSTLIEIDR